MADFPKATARPASRFLVPWPAVLGGLVPALFGGMVMGLGSGGAKGVFQANALAVWLCAAHGVMLAVLMRPLRTALLQSAVVLLGLLGLHGLLRGGDGLFVLLGLGATAWLVGYGVTRLGVGLRLPVAAAGLAALLLWGVGATSLFWADPVGEPLQVTERLAARSEMLAWDPVTTLAEHSAGFDRLHDGPIYSTVDLAASSVVRPDLKGILLRWGSLGLLALLAGCTLRRYEALDPTTL